MKAKPKDIDVVSFIDYRIYFRKEAEVKFLKERFQENKKLDAYLIYRSYPGHPQFIHAQLMYEYWAALFRRTREDDFGNRHSKGLIKINFYEK